MLHVISCTFSGENALILLFFDNYLAFIFIVPSQISFTLSRQEQIIETHRSWLRYMYRHSHLHNASSKCGNRIGGEKRWRKGTVKECSPRNVKRRGAGCRFRSDNLYEQINENPPSSEHTRREKKRRTRAERKKGTIRLRCFNSLSGDNDLRQVDPRFLHFFRSRQTPPAVIW